MSTDDTGQDTPAEENAPERAELRPLPLLTPGLVFILLFVTFAAATGVRLLHIGKTPLDFHPARQYRCATIARGYYAKGNEKVPEQIREVAKKNQFHDGLLEPPILEMISATVFRMIGKEDLSFPRFLSILCWLAGGVLLFLLARRMAGHQAAYLSLLYFLFIPFSVLGSRSFQPEPMMVMLSLGAIYLIWRYHEAPATKAVLIAAAVAAVPIFIKPTCVFIIFAAFGIPLLFQHGVVGTFKRKETYLFFLSLIPAIIYYGWGLLTVEKLQGQADASFQAGLFLEPRYYLGWLRMIGRTVGIIPIIIAIAGLFMIPDKKQRIFFGGLFFGYLCYGLLFNYHIHTHDYYSLQLIPVVALPMGLILIILFNKTIDGWKRNKMLVIAPILVLGLIGAGAAGGLLVLKKQGKIDDGVKDVIKNSILLVGLSKKVVMLVKPGRYQFEKRREFQEAIGNHIDHSLSTVYLSDDNGLPLVYNAAMSGAAWPTEKWISYFEKDGRMSVQDRFDVYFQDASEIKHSHTKVQNPDFFIIDDFGEFDRKPELAEFLKQFPIVHQEPRTETRDFGYIIYDLRVYSKHPKAKASVFPDPDVPGTPEDEVVPQEPGEPDAAPALQE